MNNSWIERVRDRLSSTWAVLTGRAYAGYSVPDYMDEVRLRAALCEIEEIIEDKADVDDGMPNDAMRILVIVRAAVPKDKEHG